MDNEINDNIIGKRQLKFVHLNCNGLVTKRVNKLNSPFFRNLFSHNDILLFSETWTSGMSELDVDYFDCLQLHRTMRNPKSKRDSGGLVVYVRSCLSTQVKLQVMDSDDIIIIKIDNQLIGSTDLFVLFAYVLPENTSRQGMQESDTLDRLQNFMTDIENEYANNGVECEFIMCADTNGRTQTCPDYVVESDSSSHYVPLPDDYRVDEMLPRSSKDKVTNGNGRHLLDFCKATSLRICNGRLGKDKNIGEFTYVTSRGASVVDYLLCPSKLFHLVSEFYIAEPNQYSDHSCVHFALNVCQNNNEHNPKTSGRSKRYVWNDEHSTEFCNSFAGEESQVKLDQMMQILQDENSINVDTLDEALNCFNEAIYSAADPLFARFSTAGRPKCTFVEHKIPWYSEDCEEMRRVFFDKLNMYRLDNSDLNRSNMAKARNAFRKCARACRYKFDKEKADALLRARRSNAKENWKLLKGVTPLPKCNIAKNDFAEYFAAVNNPDDHFYNADEDVLEFVDRYVDGELDVMFQELNVEIEHGEIDKAIGELHNNRSSGSDLLINEFLVKAKLPLLPYLCRLFNTVFSSGIFPSVWSEGIVIPLHKKGSRHDVENYRGITLLSVLGKLFTKILNNRLVEWADCYEVYVDTQAGFRKNLGTVDNIYVLSGLISHYVNSGKKLFCAFVDFSKAFDYVVRDNLWYKLIKLGIQGKILNIIRSMYKQVSSRVRVNNEMSDEFECNTGVRQGESLSPFLFCMFVNDLENELYTKGFEGVDAGWIKLYILLYADDIVIFSESAIGLQKGLDCLSEYCDRWRMKVNVGKTKVVIFRKGGRLSSDLRFIYNNNTLEIVSKFTYLGLVYTPGGSVSEAQQTLAGQACKAVYKLEKCLRPFVGIKPSHKLDMFDKLITPILCYGAEVWGFHQAMAVERVHLSFCKRVLGVKQSTQNNFVYGELGRPPLILSRYSRIIKYWFKLVQQSDGKNLQKAVYMLLLDDCARMPEKVNWVSLVKMLLCKHGFGDVWIQQGVGSVELFLRMFKTRLQDNFMQEWHNELSESTRAVTYRHISVFEYKLYLDIISAEKFRTALTRLRVSSHRLAVETGRWHKPNSIPYELRKCTVCDVLEDEYHFMLECSSYTNLRNIYIPKRYHQHPSMLLFIEMMTSTNVKLLRNIACYTNKAMEQRNDIVYHNVVK
jgi:hypothetical protein